MLPTANCQLSTVNCQLPTAHRPPPTTQINSKLKTQNYFYLCLMQILIINGPNLNLLGKRDPDIYGNESFDDYLLKLKKEFDSVRIDHFQSNVEGELINKLQQADGNYNAVILNAAGYTHTSVAIGDAVEAIDTPVIEVHISNIFAREEFRHISYISPHAKGIMSGFGLDVYRLAILHLIN